MQWPAVPMYLLPSDPRKRKFSVHCPTSERTIAPGRTPGQVPVPSGAAASAGGIKAHGTPPRVQLAGLDVPGSPRERASAAGTWFEPEPHPSRAMTTAVIAMMVLLADIFRSSSYRMGRGRTAVKGADGS